MFDKGKSNNGKDILGKTNRIVEGTKLKGDIHSVADFRLDGELIGDFTSSGKLVIGESGRVTGNISCKNMDIEGYYEGRAEVLELLSIKSKAQIKGEVVVGKLSVEPGAEFTAVCQMRGSAAVKNLLAANERPKLQEEAI